MHLAFSTAISGMILIEVVKFGNIWPIGRHIQGFYEMFLNDKDKSGAFSLSPLYLIFGCAIPVYVSRYVFGWQLIL